LRKTKDSKKQVFKKKKPQTKVIVTARSKLKKWQAVLEEAKANAILYPTRKNIKAYIIIHNDLMDRTEHFANQWQTVHLNNPELDYSVKHPYQAVALKAYYSDQNKARTQVIRKIAKTHGFFFFFSHKSAACKAFAPIIKHWAASKQIKIIAVSMDGSGLPEFPEFRRDNGISKKFGIYKLPSLIGVNPKTNSVLKISSGVLPIPEIENRIVHLVTGGRL